MFERQLELIQYWENTMAKPLYQNPQRLTRYGFKVYSQNDEDGIIQEIFNRIGVTNKIFVEIGSGDGLENNTAKLLVEGWGGLWIEGYPPNYLNAEQHFLPFVNIQRLIIKNFMVTRENINDLMHLWTNVDLLSIDIDGNDYWVWEALKLARPRVVVIEYNAVLHPPMSLVMPYNPANVWNGTNYFGASLNALVKLGKAKGYNIVGCNFTGQNAFFVRDDLCQDRFWEPATAEEHYEPPRYFFDVWKAGHAPFPGVYQTV